MNSSPFAYISTVENPPQDGNVFKCPVFCKKNYNHKCRDYYLSLINNPGFYVCPYGFATNVIDLEGTTLTLTALNIEKISLRKDVRKRINKNELYPRLKLVDYEYIISKFYDTNLPNSGIGIQISRDYINDIFHEIRKLNMELKRQSDYILRAVNMHSKDPVLIERAHNILSITQLMSIRLNTFDFNMNPELPFSSSKKKLIVYGKFEKVIHCLSLKSKQKNISINMNGKSHTTIQALEVFELLPFLIIENAIKYSVDNSEINVNFEESRDNLKIEVINFGPPVKSKEVPYLLNRGFRGENAKKFSAEGTGLGLHLVNAIAAVHDIELGIFPNSASFTEKGQELSEFIATLTIKI